MGLGAGVCAAVVCVALCMRWRSTQYAELDQQEPFKAGSDGGTEPALASPSPPSESEVGLGDWIAVPLQPAGREGADAMGGDAVEAVKGGGEDRTMLAKRLEDADALQQLEREKVKVGGGGGGAYAGATEIGSLQEPFIPPLAVPAIWPEAEVEPPAATAALSPPPVVAPPPRRSGSGQGALSGVTAVSDGDATGRVGPVAGSESPGSTRRGGRVGSGATRSAARSVTGLLPGPGESSTGVMVGMESTQSRGSISNSGTASLVQESVAAAVRKLQERLQEDLQADHLHLHAVLGRGGFGVVHRGAAPLPTHACASCICCPDAPAPTQSFVVIPPV